MTIRHLTVFAAVAEQGSMSAAAKHLYLSQPTVSQAVRELEAHYNGLLFERLGKKLYLTERGKLLLPHAREMIRQFCLADWDGMPAWNFLISIISLCRESRWRLKAHC